MPETVNRRQWLAAGAALAGGASLAAIAPSARATTHTTETLQQPRTIARVAGLLKVPANGREYSRVPLARESITVSAVQSRVRAVDGKRPQPGIRANLDHMLKLIDKSQFFGGKKDLLCFHEFPLQGWNPWDRKELERLSIEVPGEETEAISAKARQYECYIKFGAYVVDKDWPGHVLSITSIIGPNGELVARDWKARNIKGTFPGFELVTTTVYNVLDRYIEMYGEDAVIPVHRTPIGNLATSSTQMEPELFRCMAIKGAELILRTASGGFTPGDMQMTSAYNKVYTVIVNNSVSPDNPGFMDDAFGGAGGTAIYGPRGETVAEADSKFEQQVIARVPIASFRRGHQIPDVHKELYTPVVDAYTPRFDANLFAEQLPTSLADAKRFLAERDNWR